MASPLTESPVLLEVQVRVVGGDLVVGELGEPVDEMGAEEGVDVLDEELGIPCPVVGPTAQVAHYFVLLVVAICGNRLKVRVHGHVCLTNACKN